MEVETMKLTLHWLFLVLAWSDFNVTVKLCISSHLQESWKTDQFHYQVLVATTFMLSWIHEFMNSWLIKVHENQVMKYESMKACFHAFVLQLSRYMKIRWCNMKACFHAFVLQLSRYMKIRWCKMKYTFKHLYCNYQGT